MTDMGSKVGRERPSDGQAERLAVLARYGILDTPPEAGFDDIAQLASQICGAPTALVSFVAEGRQWFKARLGLEVAQTPLDQSICRHALGEAGLLVIPDLTEDVRTRDNALVTGEPFIRFYAGTRLESPDGVPLGTLCVIDLKPRPDGLTSAQAEGLKALARQLMAQLELRRAVAERDAATAAAREEDARRRQLLASAVDVAIIATDRDGRVIEWNTGAERIFGWSAEDMLGASADRIFSPEDRAAGAARSMMEHALAEGRCTIEHWHLRKDGARVWARGEIMPLRNSQGAQIGFLKILRDESARREAAERLRLSEESLQGILASSEDCIQILDLDGNLVFMSEGGQRAMEVVDFEAIRGRPWPVTCPDEIRPLARAAVQAARAGRTGHYQGPNPTFAGKPKWWDVRVTPILGATGRPEKLLAISRDITAARDAENDLRRSQERLGLALGASGMVGIWDWDLTTDLVYADANFARIYSVDPAWAARGAPLSEYVRNVHPDDRAALRAELGRLFAGAEEFCNEYRVLQPDGSTRWVLARGRMVRDAEGRPVRFPGASVDITERKRAEERRLALLELGDRLRELTDAAAMSFAAAEIMGRTLQAKRAGYGTVSLAGEMISIERDWTQPGIASIAGTHTFRDFGSFVDDLKRGAIVVVDDTGRDPRTAAKTAALDAIGVRSIVNIPVMEQGRFVALFYIHGDDARSWGEEQIAFVRNVADRTRAAVERRHAEDMLLDLNAALEQRVAERTRERDRVWRNSQDLLVVLDRHGVFRSVNPAALKILGCRPEEMVGRTLFDFIHPDDRALAAGMLEMDGAEDLPTFTNRYRREDGTYRWIAWRTAPEDDLIYGYGRDVTAEREQAEALRFAEEQLRQSQKMEAVGQLTGGVAHDFNNLLTVIRSSVDLLKRPDLAEERRRRYVEAISDTAARAAKLTGQLLAFARRQALKPEVFDVVESVRRMGDMVVTLTGSRIAVETLVPDLPCHVDADPSQFDTALVNLAVNARDAMDGEGRLTIAVAVSSKVPALRAPPAAGESFVAVSITDTGAGIPAAHLDKIFEPFFTTKPVGQGTGLGLSQVFGFVKQSGGEISVSSEPGRGSTFTLYLPQVAAPRRPAPCEGGLETPMDGDGLRVLLVEDNADVGAFATQTLRELGYDTALAADASEALKLLGRARASFDVVFSDVVMPGMNGIELGQEIRRLYPDLPVVLTSGYSHVLAQNGTFGFALLHKPYSVEDLSRALRQARARRQRALDAAQA